MLAQALNLGEIGEIFSSCSLVPTRQERPLIARPQTGRFPFGLLGIARPQHIVVRRDLGIVEQRLAGTCPSIKELRRRQLSCPLGGDRLAEGVPAAEPGDGLGQRPRGRHANEA